MMPLIDIQTDEVRSMILAYVLVEKPNPPWADFRFQELVDHIENEAFVLGRIGFSVTASTYSSHYFFTHRASASDPTSW
jgi:hypothetical protein